MNYKHREPPHSPPVPIILTNGDLQIKTYVRVRLKHKPQHPYDYTRKCLYDALARFLDEGWRIKECPQPPLP